MSLKYETIKFNSRLAYCRHGEYHKVDGASVIWWSDTRYWYYYGKSHRIGGPADMYASGTNDYYIWNQKYTKEEYESKIHHYQNIL